MKGVGVRLERRGYNLLVCLRGFPKLSYYVFDFLIKKERITFYTARIFYGTCFWQ